MNSVNTLVEIIEKSPYNFIGEPGFIITKELKDNIISQLMLLQSAQVSNEKVSQVY